MIDRVTFGVDDLVAARAFYDAALAPLGVTCAGSCLTLAHGSVTHGVHLCFAAASADEVDAFHAAAVAAGAADNGRPGLRAYHPRYYGAFVGDPAGNNIEAVFHGTARFAPGAIDHVNLKVRDVAAALAFYEPLLAALDIARVDYAAAGFGRGGVHLFLDESPTPSAHVRVAFAGGTTQRTDPDGNSVCA